MNNYSTCCRVDSAAFGFSRLACLIARLLSVSMAPWSLILVFPVTAKLITPLDQEIIFALFFQYVLG
jgi:hypothetical protein